MKQPGKKSYGVADKALEYFGKLYEIEDEAKDLSNEDRYKLRQEKAIPIRNEFFTWLKEEQGIVMPGTKLDEAIYYAVNNEPEL